MNKIQNQQSRKKDIQIKDLERLNESLKIENALLKQRLATILNIANLEKGYWFKKDETIPEIKEALQLKEVENQRTENYNKITLEPINREEKNDHGSN